MVRGLWRELSGRALLLAGAVTGAASLTRAGNRRRWLGRIDRHGAPVAVVQPLTGHMQAIPVLVRARPRR